MDQSVRQLLSPDFVRTIRRLDLRARTLVDGWLAGRHRAARRGFSVEFSDYRQYVPGDRPEDIDWKVYVRTDQYHVRQYRAETNLRCTLVVDGSLSMRYQSPPAAMSKIEYARSVAAALAWLLFRQHDRVGLIIARDRLLTHLPPRSRRSHLYQLFRELTRVEPAEGGWFGEGLRKAAAQIRKRALIVAVSDFLPAVDARGKVDYEGQLAALRRAIGELRFRRHDVILLQVLDPGERQLPFREPVLLADPESELELPTDGRSAGNDYRRAMDAWINRIRREAARQGARHLLLTTDQPFDQTLAEFLRRG